jgi:hypothetical protein
VTDADDELRARFADLRASDERSAPDFHGVLDRAKRAPYADARRLRLRAPLALFIAAAAVVVAAVGIARVSALRRAAFVATPLSTWTSPTAGLLRTQGFDRVRPASVVAALVAIANAPVIPQRGPYK